MPIQKYKIPRFNSRELSLPVDLGENNQSTTKYDPSPSFFSRLPFRSVKELTEDQVGHLAEMYFDFCIKEQRYPTMSGLAMTFGVTRKDLMYNMSKDANIQKQIDFAKQRMEDYVEQLLLSGKPPVGPIFWLKNNAFWVDVKELKHSDKTMEEILDELDQEHNPNQVIDGEIAQPNLHPAPLLSESPT